MLRDAQADSAVRDALRHTVTTPYHRSLLDEFHGRVLRGPGCPFIEPFY
jgi:hypothetical protein